MLVVIGELISEHPALTKQVVTTETKEKKTGEKKQRPGRKGAKAESFSGRWGGVEEGRNLLMERKHPPPDPCPSPTDIFFHLSFLPFVPPRCQTYFQSPGKSVDSSLFPLLGLLAGYPFQQTWWSEYSR